MNIFLKNNRYITKDDIIKTNINYTYNQMKLDLNMLKNRYPFLEIGNIGKSVLNNDIPYVRIGNGTKQVLYHFAIHANEWLTSIIAMKFIEDFSKCYVSDTNIFGFRARVLFENCKLYIIPMMNPDGVNLVNGYINKNDDAYIKAKKIANNYPEIPFKKGWKANINGVDLKNYQPFCKVL